MNAKAAKIRGFTVIELMIALAAAIALLAVGVPLFNSIVNSSQLTASTNDLVTSMHYARLEAVTRGLPVAMCPSSDGRNCTGGTDWSVGWVVFVDNGSTKGSHDSGEPRLRVYDRVTKRVTISGAKALRFTSIGELDTSI